MAKKHIKNPRMNNSQRIRTPDEIPDSKSTNDMHPAFCFKFCSEKDFTLEDCDKETKILLIDKIYQLSRISWGNIQKAPRHGLGHEKIDQESIKIPLPTNTPGDRNFLVFRLGGGKNSVFIGYRQDKVFHVVYVDRNGEAYKH